MNTYSPDLRQKIVDLYCQGQGSTRQLAKRFNVSPTFVRGLLRKARQAGRDIPQPYVRGVKPLLQDEHYPIIQHLAEADRGATLQQLATRFQEQTQMTVSISTVSRALRKLGMPRIQRSKRLERNSAAGKR